MKHFIALLIPIICACTIHASEPICIAKDSTGMIVQLKEKYGMQSTECCKVIMKCESNFVLTKGDNKSSWYPCENFSLKILERGVSCIK